MASGLDLVLTQVDTLIDPNAHYQTDIMITNTGTVARDVILYRALDCSLSQINDSGFGELTGNSVGCLLRDTDVSNTTDPSLPISYAMRLVDLSGGSRKELNTYDRLWGRIGARHEFTDQCNSSGNCDEYLDNAMGLSWRVTIAAGGSVSFSHQTVFYSRSAAAPASVQTVPADHPLALGLGIGALLAGAAARRRRRAR